MRFTAFIAKNLIRRPLRSLLTISAMSVAVGAVVALVGIAYGFERSFRDLYRAAGIDVVVTRAGLQAQTSALDEQLVNKISTVPGVSAATGGLLEFLALEEHEYLRVAVRGGNPESVFFDYLDVVDGRRLAPGDKKSVVLGEVLAETLDMKAGDELVLFEDEKYTVVGVYQADNTWDNGAMFMDLGELQRLVGRPGQVTGFFISVEDSTDEAAVERICNDIEKLDKHLSAKPSDEYARSIEQLQMARAMAWLTSTLAVIVGSIGILNTMIMSVFERTREIGILRAIGWRKGRVVRMVLLESIVLSMAGAVVGTIGAVLLTWFLSTMPMVGGVIDARIAPQVILQGFLIALVVGLIGGAYPAYHGANLLPTTALRHE